MKKVLFTATVDSHILQFHLPYLKWFKQQGFEVHVATNGNANIPYCDKKYIIPFERSPLKINNLIAIKKLKKIIDRENFEIIHCHTPVGSVVTRISAIEARKKNTRVIYTAHGFHFAKGGSILNWMLFFPVEYWLSKYTDCLITINEEDYNLAKKMLKMKQLEFIDGVGVDEERFNFELKSSERKKLRESMGIKEDDFVLIQVGELYKRKNQTMSINAMKDLVKKHKDIHLLLVGTGSLEEKYKKKILSNNLSENIHMLGYRKDIPKLLKISNVLLSLSYREGLPVNVMEAMFCGLPIIATDCRGNRDLVDDLIKCNDVKSLKRQIESEYISRNKKIYDVEKYKQKNILNFVIDNVYSVGKRI